MPVATAVFEAVPFVHAVTGDDACGLEPSEVDGGERGVFRRTPEGGLEVRPVRTWT